MRTITTSRTAAAVIAGLSLTGALAGCATTTDSATTPSSTATTTPSPSASSSTGSTDAATTSKFTDGTYTESADYSAPSGTETIDVTLTLADGVVTAVEVTGHATDPQAKLHQSEFANGIAAVVVGKPIDQLSVDKVGGSSLTSTGFTKAVELIESDATA